jgi:PKD repeat protein
MKLSHGAGRRQLRVGAGIAAAVTMVAGIVVSWNQVRDVAPRVRLHAGAAWVASEQTGQLTLLDGASAEVAAQVLVGRPGNDLYAAQQGTTGYAINRVQGAVVRIDGATLETSRQQSPVAEADGQLTVFPTPHALYTLDAVRGLLAKADPETLQSQGDPQPLTAGAAVDGAVMDPDGHLWTLDQHSGDLVWLADGTRHSRPQAHTPGRSRLTLTDRRPALLDAARGTMELLDPDTGVVQQSVPVGLRPEDTVAVSGSPDERRLLISLGSRGQLLSCTFGAGSCAAPVALSSASADLGQAVEADNHAVVPDYATGRVWIVDLAGPRVVAERRLFDRPVRFDLLARDGVVFYNDPGSERAGVIELDGRVRPITKYRLGQGSSTVSPTQANVGPADTTPVAPPSGTQPDPQSGAAVSIGISPRERGLVGEEFHFAVIAKSAAGITGAQWTFGDGAGATGTAARHRYDRPGTYPVSVAARFRQGQVAHASAQVVVDTPETLPRITRINVEPGAPRVGEQVRFSAELAGTSPQGMVWTVTGEQGTETTSSASQFQHAFTRPGAYTVTLAVTVGANTVRQSTQFTVTPESREVRCGDVITADAVVTKDLVCPGGVGLTIAASNVVLDLGGHTIRADGPAAARKGIVVAAGRTIRNITIRNGAVSRFQTGVEMVDVAGVNVTNFAVSASPMTQASLPGIVGDRARDVRLRSVTVNAFHPFGFDHGSTVAITGSTISGNQAARGVATCANKSVCTIERSSVTLYGLQCYNGSEENSGAVSVVDDSQVSIVHFGTNCETATVANSDVSLLEHADAEQTYITGNRVSGNYNLELWVSFTVTGNVFSGSAWHGVMITSGRGVVKGNTFVENGKNGLAVKETFGDPIGPLDISDNEFVRNGLDGDAEVGMDGLAVEQMAPGSFVKVSNNRTTGNARYGINAEPGSVAESVGNTSSGDRMGCRGVVCS